MKLWQKWVLLIQKYHLIKAYLVPFSLLTHLALAWNEQKVQSNQQRMSPGSTSLTMRSELSALTTVGPALSCGLPSTPTPGRKSRACSHCHIRSELLHQHSSLTLHSSNHEGRQEDRFTRTPCFLPLCHHSVSCSCHAMWQLNHVHTLAPCFEM